MVYVNRSMGTALAALHLVALVGLTGLLAGCEDPLPPATSPTAALAAPVGDQGSVVFVMPHTKCDGLGYYVIADEDGHFIGNIAFGTRLAVSVRPGAHAYYSWSSLDLRYSVNQNWNPQAAVRVTVGRAETQYVTIMPSLYPNCQVWPLMEMSSDSSRRKKDFADLQAMLADTKPVVADVAAGQAELDSKPAFFQTNLELGAWKLYRIELEDARRERREAIAAELGWAGYSREQPQH
jgi:hypothetical protein